MAERGKTPSRALLKPLVAMHNLIYRTSGGRIWGHFGKGPVLLLTVNGRKTGKPQTVPLIYVQTDRGHAVIASFAGSPTHPAWYLNLDAAGVAEIQIGARRRRVTAAHVAYGSPAYSDIWRRAVVLYPDYETYKTRTARPIPIVELVAQ
ncbi:MAG TPA: nitroreductase/quinone reductase family protein [Rhizomicrobium sp.]|jgi:deazaflavin-dependent oxidoreductase (nitroreductase family)|nr:nitroreductase/quinone reductase family protein [Rhizomicrobium sp.]